MGLASLMTGCVSGAQQVIVSESAVPDQPVFTVIPANLSSSEVERAAHIQSCLLHYGMKVVERPALDSVEQREASGRTRETQDIVATFPEANADILVISHAASNRIKMLNKHHEYRVIVSETYSKSDASATCKVLWYALVGLNLVTDPG